MNNSTTPAALAEITDLATFTKAYYEQVGALNAWLTRQTLKLFERHELTYEPTTNGVPQDIDAEHVLADPFPEVDHLEDPDWEEADWLELELCNAREKVITEFFENGNLIAGLAHQLASRYNPEQRAEKEAEYLWWMFADDYPFALYHFLNDNGPLTTANWLVELRERGLPELMDELTENLSVDRLKDDYAEEYTELSEWVAQQLKNSPSAN